MCLIDTVYSSQIHGNASVNVVYNVEFAYIFFSILRFWKNKQINTCE